MPMRSIETRTKARFLGAPKPPKANLDDYRNRPWYGSKDIDSFFPSLTAQVGELAQPMEPFVLFKTFRAPGVGAAVVFFI